MIMKKTLRAKIDTITSTIVFDRDNQLGSLPTTDRGEIEYLQT